MIHSRGWGSRPRHAVLAGLLILAIGAGSLARYAPAALAAFGESFDDVAGLASWVAHNSSSPAGDGAIGWLQGNTGPFQGSFPSHSGSADAYAASAWQNAAIGTDAVISNWLITPELRLRNGDQISFWTRSNGCADLFNGPDRLQVRMSTNGASVDVGTYAGDVGDFTMLLKDINPSYASDDDPAGAAGYPCGDWAQFTIVLEGLSQPITGRIAFRHYVVDVASNGWYVGLDDVAYSGATSADPTETATATASPSPSAAATATPTETPTATATASPSPSATATATLTPAQPKQYFALVRYDAGARSADSGH